MHQRVLDFWFKETAPSNWWKKDANFDAFIAQEFAQIHAKAVQCELYEWRATAEGRLAEIIILDQFSRNMFRGTAKSFSADALALALAQEAVSIKADTKLDATQRSFLYMPYMHSESLAIHEVAVALYESKGLEKNLEFELKHKKIIERFGRYPHRNDILGRVSTKEELDFLKQPGSSF